MRDILASYRQDIAVDLDIAAFLLTRGAASVIGTAFDERPALLEDGRLAEALSTMLIDYMHRKPS